MTLMDVAAALLALVSAPVFFALLSGRMKLPTACVALFSAFVVVAAAALYSREWAYFEFFVCGMTVFAAIWWLTRLDKFSDRQRVRRWH